MKKITRRQFLSSSAAVLATTLPCRNFLPSAPKSCEAALSEDIRGKVFKGDAPKALWKWSKEGFLYKKLGKHKVSGSNGVGCLYINKLADIDLNVLEEIVEKAYKHNKKQAG